MLETVRSKNAAEYSGREKALKFSELFQSPA
jgi:hypothetical protein